ncbi:hypothetical protein PLICRDRAFT_125235 [Plicaturopsis crispa FD-325 SS-3]|nr:hypothetical protein PLICRDRAFT_125235 [Plicaturopsis crispa FD-325 SS-3]
MGFATMLTLLLTHPIEFRTLVQFKLYHEQQRDLSDPAEHVTSGWNRKTMRRCWELLDMTSRSFSTVVKMLDGDLARVIALFYLVLRGLDTIEDDMTIPDDQKQVLLRSFHKNTVTPGWTFDGNGPDEKDRQLLVEYDKVVFEINTLSPEYKNVILDICEKMEVGMADYAHKAATTGSIYLETVAEYDLYCHYVAGLVGEGLSGIWSASGKEAAWLHEQLELSNSMGSLLQKTNIIRDFREDVDESRFFWPREIWGKYGFTEMKEMYALENAERAQWAQSGMVVDALRHTTDALDYLRLLRSQTVFNFCAIPATMAMATLALCFMNPEMLQRNVKIRKAAAASLIMRSTNPREVAYIFREFAREIHTKAVPTDPNFLRISVACGRIEQWCEHYYPSFVRVMQSNQGMSPQQLINPTDARTRIIAADQARDADIANQKRVAEIRKGTGLQQPAPQQKQDNGVPKELLMYVFAAFAIVLAVGVGAVYTIIWFVDMQQ